MKKATDASECESSMSQEAFVRESGEATDGFRDLPGASSRD
ncbi:MAG: hypothetical protein ACOX5I_04110 [Gleimia sp.]